MKVLSDLFANWYLLSSSTQTTSRSEPWYSLVKRQYTKLSHICGFVDLDLARIMSVDCRQLLKSLKIVDCRLKTYLRSKFVGRNLRFEMEIVDFVIFALI